MGSFIQDLAFFTPRFPRPGETVLGDFRAGPGGKGFNQAVAATRAGAPTLFVGAVGRDGFGAAAKAFVRQAGIRAQLVEKPKCVTGAAGIIIGADGQNQIVVSPGANFALHPADVPAALFRGSRVVVCQGESDLRLVAHVLRAARRAGAATVLNPAPMRPGLDGPLLRHVDILVPNETEFGALLARKAPGAARRLGTGDLARRTPEQLHAACRSLGVPVVIVTLGRRGCLLSEPERWSWIRAHEVEPVDTTGAGDAFVGGLAAGLVRFRSNLAEAANFANAVAALSIMRPGTAESMPTSREIARFLRRRDHG